MARHENAGSSPHTRGAQCAVFHNPGHAGIIPAYAGSTHSCASPRFDPWDHPRIRGEHVEVAGREPFGGGSSPHTRGAQPGQQIRLDLTRIIPAYAGSTE